MQSHKLLQASQQPFIAAMKIFDYPVDDKGVCQGLVAAWMQYVFSPHLDEFDELIGLIYQYQTEDLKQRIQQAEAKQKTVLENNNKKIKFSHEEKLLLKIRALCDVVFRNFEADSLPDLYPEDNKPFAQKLNQTMSLGLMQSLESRRGLEQIQQFSGSYNQKKMRDYLILLLMHIKNHNLNVRLATSFANQTHIIGFAYDPALKTWLFYNPNRPPTHRTNDLQQLSNWIISSFRYENKKLVAFISELFSITRSQHRVKKCIDKMMSSELFLKLHAINDETFDELVDRAFIAIEANETTYIKQLFAKLDQINPNYDINKVFNSRNATLLDEATGYHDFEIMKFLITKGADVNAPSQKDKKTPLFSACEFNYVAGAELLLNAGADPDLFLSPKNPTSLFYSASKNYYESVKLLLTHGANPNLASPEALFPLHLAVLHDNFEMIDLLIQYHANCKYLGKMNISSIASIASKLDRKLLFENYLIAKNTSLDQQYIYMTPYDLAQFVSTPKVMQRLSSAQQTIFPTIIQKRSHHAALFQENIKDNTDTLIDHNPKTKMMKTPTFTGEI